jgi:hypothetical protein
MSHVIVWLSDEQYCHAQGLPNQTEVRNENSKKNVLKFPDLEPWK